MAKANRILPRKHTGHIKHLFNNPRENFTHGHHQMFNTEIRLITFFVAEDGEAVYSHQKQDLELTVSQIISSSWKNSGLNKRKWGKPLGQSGIT